jgi:uncharacterized protein YggE
MTAFVVGTLLLPYHAQAPAKAQAQPTQVSPPLRTVTVSGTGMAEVTPDMAVVTLGVQSDAQTAKEAMTENSSQMEAVMNALRSAGVASTDIKTTSIQLYPRYDTTPVASQPEQPTQPNRLTGFTAVNVVELKVRNLANLGAVLDQAVTAGSNQIQGIRFDVSDPVKAVDQAREAAMRDASRKAQQLVSLANTRLGQVLTINESSRVPVPAVAVMEMRAADSSVPVSPGTQTITVDLQVTWELQ